MKKCNICNSEVNIIRVEEQMLGLKEVFEYCQCISCGHTFLSIIPSNIEKYYNQEDYYSFKVKNNFSLENIINEILLVFKKTLINFKKNSILYSSALKSLLLATNFDKSKKVLDYGCGAGQFVKELKKLGFHTVKGFDPFLEKEEYDNNTLLLTNKSEEIQRNKWDVITLNHVFEHLENPIQTLKDFSSILSETGIIILRFPVIDSYAYEKYKSNWVQFDAPRHINLFTRKSIQIAIKSTMDYRITKIYDDSFHFQFTGSEIYEKGISLKNGNNRLKRLLSLKSYKYHLKAKRLNKINKGDQIVVILERK